MGKRKTRRKGYSIIETIIVTALSVIVFFAMANLFFRYYKVYNRQQAEIGMADSARSAGKELQKYVLQAEEILENHDFSGTTYSTDEDTLVLKIPSVDASGNIINGEFDYVAFYLTGATLYRRMEVNTESSRTTGTDQVASDITFLSFTYNSADLSKADKIEAEIGMQKTVSSQTISYDFRQTMYLRNL